MPVGRSMHISALRQLSVFRLRGVILYDIHKKQFGLQNTRNTWRENVLAQRTFGAKVHKSNIRVKRWHNKCEIIN